MIKNTFKSRLILQWTIYAGVMSFLLWLSWQMQILGSIFASDPTRITFLIALFFLGGTIHCGIRAVYLSQQLNSIIDIEDNSLSWHDEESLPAEFLKIITKSLQGQSFNDEKNSPDNALLAEVFAEQAHAQHEVGWFFTSLLVKLGLLGTVIGFVLMLGPLSTLKSFDIADVQGILTSMTAGMGVALNTTLLGLLGSMLLSFQYLLLDRGADELVARTVQYMETELIPVLHHKTD
jgi:biopolymer transport protein ExbB/TolQ